MRNLAISTHLLLNNLIFSFICMFMRGRVNFSWVDPVAAIHPSHWSKVSESMFFKKIKNRDFLKRKINVFML